VPPALLPKSSIHEGLEITFSILRDGVSEKVQDDSRPHGQRIAPNGPVSAWIKRKCVLVWPWIISELENKKIWKKLLDCGRLLADGGRTGANWAV
jgi:hypothetical protein